MSIWHHCATWVHQTGPFFQFCDNKSNNGSILIHIFSRTLNVVVYTKIKKFFFPITCSTYGLCPIWPVSKLTPLSPTAFVLRQKLKHDHPDLVNKIMKLHIIVIGEVFSILNITDDMYMGYIFTLLSPRNCS
jgi:hypothetical protein